MVSGSYLFSWMKGTERGGGDEELPLVIVHRLQVDRVEQQQVAREVDNCRAEVIGTSRLSSETREGSLVAKPLVGVLPSRAQMVLSWLDGKKQV